LAKYRCIRHADAPAAVMCHQCHKPICKACVVAMPSGSFCSAECAAMNKSVKAHLKGFTGPKPRGLVVAVGLFLAVVLATVLFHFVVAMFEPGSPTRKKLGKFDLWEQLLNTTQEKGLEKREKRP
jgi:hypothetical protein